MLALVKLNFLIILFLSANHGVNSKCKQLNNYRNGLPLGINEINKDDFLGPLVITIHNLYMNSIKFWPFYATTSCETNLYKFGGLYLKISKRPRGCCTMCCEIDRVEDYVTIHYFTNKTSINVIKIDTLEPGTLTSLGFKSELKTLLYLHGWTEDPFVSRLRRHATDSYFNKKNEKFNILALDYSELVAFPFYLQAMDNVKLIAEVVSDFLIYYHKLGELRIENVHIIGVSLGAQLAAHIGKCVKKFRKVARVTGLDPGLFVYPDDDPSENIAPGDAEFVDIIHTSSTVYNVRKPSADADFFVDYTSGQLQPGCNLTTSLIRNEFAEYLVCSHVYALKMYFQTVANPYLYPVCKKVPSSGSRICGYLGYAANKSSTFGVYHLKAKKSWRWI